MKKNKFKQLNSKYKLWLEPTRTGKYTVITLAMEVNEDIPETVTIKQEGLEMIFAFTTICKGMAIYQISKVLVIKEQQNNSLRRLD